MFEATSEQQSKSSIIVVSNSSPTSASHLINTTSGPVDGAINALNEALVDAIDNHHHTIHHHHHGSATTATHINMLSASYYYCTNLLDFKHHFNQNFNLATGGYSLMPTPDVSVTTSTGNSTANTSALATSSTQPSNSTQSKPILSTISKTDLPIKSLPSDDLGLINVSIESNECEEYLNYKNFTNKSPNSKSIHKFNESDKTCTKLTPDLIQKPRSKLRNRLIKRAQLNSKRLNSSGLQSPQQQKKLNNLNKIKNILFKTYRHVTKQRITNPLRYSRSRHFHKSSSLSPTSPSSSTSSSSSSCSSSPESLVATTSTSNVSPKFRSSLKTITYKGFKKIKNKLLKCNVNELINEESDTEVDTTSVETEEKATEKNDSSQIYYECQINTIEEPVNEFQVNTNNASTATSNIDYESNQTYNSQSSLMTLQSLSTSASASSSSNYQPLNQSSDQSYYQAAQQQSQSFSYDVEMIPQQTQQFLIETEVTNHEASNPAAMINNSLNYTNPFNSSSNPNTNSTSQQQQTHAIDSSAIQQCQIKQDLLKLSYEKFKQFRLNEKLLQQTVLIRNAIKMLQYDIQFQQEQEQIILQQQHHQQQHQQIESQNNNACLGYNLNESCQIDVMQQAQNATTTAVSPVGDISECSSPSYLTSSLASNLIASSPLPSPPSPPLGTQSIPHNNPGEYHGMTSTSPQKSTNNPMISAAYENFDEFINNNILNLNQKNSVFLNQNEESDDVGNTISKSTTEACVKPVIVDSDEFEESDGEDDEEMDEVDDLTHNDRPNPFVTDNNLNENSVDLISQHPDINPNSSKADSQICLFNQNRNECDKNDNFNSINLMITKSENEESTSNELL